MHSISLVDKLRSQIADAEARIADAEARIADAEARIADAEARNAVLLAEAGELRALTILAELKLSNVLGELERAAAAAPAPELVPAADGATVVRHLTLVRSA